MSGGLSTRGLVFLVIALVGAALFAFVLLGLGYLVPFQLVIKLVFGWAWFLVRTVPEIDWNLGAIATGIIGLAILGAGTHAFLGRLLARPDPEGAVRPWRLKWTLSGLGLLLLFFVVAIASAGVVHQVGWLITSPEPFAESSWSKMGLGDLSGDRRVVPENSKSIAPTQGCTFDTQCKGDRICEGGYCREPW